MDVAVQRAILLKAMMETLHKTRGLNQAHFEEGKPDAIQGKWTRFNASADTLARGLDDYAKTVADELSSHPGALPSDPLWDQIKAFALEGRTPSLGGRLPDSLVCLPDWAEIEHRSRILQEMAGCWFIFRLTSGTKTERPEVTISVLNIRPEFYYEGRPGNWMEFALFLHSEIRGDPMVRVEGICLHYHLQLHFVGLLDRSGAPLPTAMALHYDGGGKTIAPRDHTDGLLFVTNSHRNQVGALVEAVHVAGSEAWQDEDYKDKRSVLLERLGSHAYRDIADILPEDTYEKLVERSRRALVFEAD